MERFVKGENLLLQIDVAVRDGDEEDLEVLGAGGEGEEDGEDVVDAL